MLLSFVRSAALVVGSLIYLSFAGEALHRFLDGYAFNSFSLVKRQESQRASSDDVETAQRAVIEQTWINKDVNSDLFFTPPVPFSKPVLPELQQRTSDNPSMVGQENYIWNETLLKNAPSDVRKTLGELRTSSIFAFPSYDGTQFPRFRLYPNATTGLGVTDRFGWLTPDIALEKPVGVVRVAILGDSTSHNSYALRLQSLLTAWAAQTHLTWRFEVVNAARQGLGIQDNLNVLKYELAPVSPDYVILTQAPSILFGGRTLWTAETDVGASMPTARVGWFKSRAVSFLTKYSDYSALARHLAEVLNGSSKNSIQYEPQKPQVRLVAPLDMKKAPSLDQARLFPYFDSYLKQLDQYAETSLSNNIIPIITTERACGLPGMAFPSKVNPYLYASINGPVYWPLTYRQIQQILWFNNAVIKEWSKQRKVHLVDLQLMLPKQVDLCTDVMHDTVLSQHLRAWLLFQSLVPIIKRDLNSGRIPRAAAVSADRGSILNRPMIVFDRERLIADFKSDQTN